MLVEARYRTIYYFKRRYPVKTLCELLEISRASYYAWVKRMDQPDPDQERMKLIEAAYQASRKSYGYRRIQLWIFQNYEIQINHKAVLRLMNKMGIQSVARRRKPRLMAKAIPVYIAIPNHLQRNFKASQPNQKWVTDITYIATTQAGLTSALSKTSMMCLLWLIE